jgi:hypothetical protein
VLRLREGGLFFLFPLLICSQLYFFLLYFYNLKQKNVADELFTSSSNYFFTFIIFTHQLRAIHTTMQTQLLAIILSLYFPLYAFFLGVFPTISFHSGRRKLFPAIHITLHIYRFTRTREIFFSFIFF